MINDYPVLIFCLIFGGLIGMLVLGYLATNNKLKPPFLKPAKVVYATFSVCVLLLIGAGVVYAVVDEVVGKSGWIPRTREIPVYVKAQDWVRGEIKSCVSFASKERKEIGTLVCDDGSRVLDESHVLPVRFWGSITTERNKDWKCTRESASFTCRLQ